MKGSTNDHKEIVIFSSEDGEISVQVDIRGDSVWLNLNQISELFERDKSAVSKHLKDIFKSGELEKNATVAKNATVQQEGSRKVTRTIEYYNLDAILSVGYRINSKRGTQFRKWATRVLNQHLIKGYSLNQKKLLETKLSDIERSLSLLTRTIQQKDTLSDISTEAIHIIQAYAKSWTLLLDYDENSFQTPENGNKSPLHLPYDSCVKAITQIKRELMKETPKSTLFGQERSGQLEGILGNIEQTFDGRPLYETAEERAAHLLYFIIKDHPFSDGNKRIGSFLFLLYLQINSIKPEKVFTDAALVALALLIAESKPTEKDLLIKLIHNLIS
jgi:prophage maintenance system killer protein